jgi:hypothetical protein
MPNTEPQMPIEEAITYDEIICMIDKKSGHVRIVLMNASPSEKQATDEFIATLTEAGFRRCGYWRWLARRVLGV